MNITYSSERQCFLEPDGDVYMLSSKDIILLEGLFNGETPRGIDVKINKDSSHIINHEANMIYIVEGRYDDYRSMLDDFMYSDLPQLEEAYVDMKTMSLIWVVI